MRTMEINPAKHTPDNVKHELVTTLPPLKINLEEMIKVKKDGN